MKRLREHHISFRNAFSGLKWAIKTQPNFQIHFILACIAIIVGVYLHASNTEMSVLILAIIFGLGVEMMNTSIEEMTDLITKEWRQEAKIAKDVSAGMMLLTAIGTIILALFIFVPKILERL